MGIVQPFLHMGKRAQEKHIQWQVKKRFSQDKYIKLMKGKV